MMIQGEQKNSNIENLAVGRERKTIDPNIDRLTEVEKLKQQLREAEARLAEKSSEQAEKAGQIQEGGTAKEISESFSASAPAAPAVQATQFSNSQNQVQMLCNLAFEKGVDAAIEAAKELDNPYVLDEFHDAMVGQLYEKLKKEGKIEME